ncbi:hypothetical protein BE08_42470, partial [Sorangium cellulosum]
MMLRTSTCGRALDDAPDVDVRARAGGAADDRRAAGGGAAGEFGGDVVADLEAARLDVGADRGDEIRA